MAIELEDGTIIRSLPEQVTKNQEDIGDLQTDLTALEQQVATALAGVFHYKGSVATYGDLPSSGQEVGDVWNVLSDGKNYAWSGSGWDDLGGIVDLSNYVTLDGTQTISGAKTFSQAIDATNGVAFGQGGVITDLQGGIRFTDYNSISLDYENAALFPAITSTVDLGSSTNAFKDIYLSGGITIKGASYNAKIINENNKLKINYAGTNRLEIGNVDFIIGNSPTPSTANTYDLGSSSYRWKDLYLSNSVKIGNSSITQDSSNRLEIFGYNGLILNTNGNPIQLNRDIIFSSDNSKDIGNSTRRIKDIYIAGNLSDGTNSASAADIVAQKEATKGTLRNLLALTNSLTFNTTLCVDLGSLTWYASSGMTDSFYAVLSDRAQTSKAICTKYQNYGTNIAVLDQPDKTFQARTDSQAIIFRDSDFNNVDDFKAAMKGVLFACEKA